MIQRQQPRHVAAADYDRCPIKIGDVDATGGGDWDRPGEVRLWDVGAWRERDVLKHTGEVLCLAVSPDGKLLAAGSWDRTVKVWELPGPGQGD